jgi:hypothetical protein
MTRTWTFRRLAGFGVPGLLIGAYPLFRFEAAPIASSEVNFNPSSIANSKPAKFAVVTQRPVDAAYSARRPTIRRQ